MQPQENPCRVLLGLHGDCTEGFFLKNLYCLDCMTNKSVMTFISVNKISVCLSVCHLILMGCYIIQLTVIDFGHGDDWELSPHII